MKLKSVLTVAFVLMAHVVLAAVPKDYYITIDGEQGLTLKLRLCDIIKNHTVFSYSSLWTYYPSTYNVNGTTEVLDMYSDNIRHYSGTTAVANMNKEHTVPKSWWGGTAACNGYSDIFNVIPSDQEANGRKSNYALGVVSKVTYTNDVTTVGTGTVNGFSATFFEPKDEYKGDFARIYFYMATCYPDAAWDTNEAVAMTNSDPLTLKSWIVPMLLEWSQNDPVDSAEVARNENIYKVQGNRNPFIDYPELATYIWGSKSNSDFNLSEHKPNDGTSNVVLHAGLPGFSVVGGTEAEPYKVSEGTTVRVKGGNSSAMLYVRIDDGEWKAYKPTKGWNSTSQSEYYVTAATDIAIDGTMLVEAFCSVEGRENSDTISYWYKTVNFNDEYLLYEAFDDITAGNNIATSGSSSKWNGNDNFSLLENIYQSGNSVKLGTGSKTGSLTTKTLDFAGGTLSVSLDVKGWTNVEGSIQVSVTGCDSQTKSYTAKMEDDFETLTFTFTGVAANPSVTIGTTSKRAFIDNIKVSGSSSATIVAPVADGENVVTEVYDLAGRRLSAGKVRGIVLVKTRNGKVVPVMGK